jgi:hypothetical protein
MPALVAGIHAFDWGELRHVDARVKLAHDD